MSRTAELSLYQWKTIHSTVLLIIAFCLAAHFLVEDVFLLRAMESSALNYSTTGLAFEMEHLDDLVMMIHLPDSIPYNHPPAVAAWNIRLEQQPASPIRIPPKIA